MKKIAFLLIFVSVMLTACGKTESGSPAQYSNPTLKDIESVDFSEFTQDQQQTAETQNYSWSPRGNYTYVFPDAVRGYQTAMIRVDSVDFSLSEAYVSYVLGAVDGTTENSNGILACGMETIDHDDGTREIYITIDDSKSLEFSGTASDRTAVFCFEGLRYNLKKEG